MLKNDGKTKACGAARIKQEQGPPCLKMMPENCQMLPGNYLEAGIISMGSTLRLESPQLSAEGRHTRNARNPLPSILATKYSSSGFIARSSSAIRATTLLPIFTPVQNSGRGFLVFLVWRALADN